MQSKWISAFDAAIAALDTDQAVAGLHLRPLLVIVVCGDGGDGGANLAQRVDSGVVDVTVDELGQPRVTNTRLIHDGLPIAAAALKQQLQLSLNGGQRFIHPAILVKYSCVVKEQITKWMGHPHPVPEKSISKVVAVNLKYWMDQAQMSQTTLAVKAGVSQKTISNYLNPAQRVESASGKTPSPKLEELDKIAKALAIPVWQLVREMSEKERRMYEHIERAYSELTAPATEKRK